MEPPEKMSAVAMRALPTGFVTLLVFIASFTWNRSAAAQCAQPCTGPTPPTMQVESDTPLLGAWGSVAICECNSFVIGWHQYVVEGHNGCGTNPGVRAETVAQGYQADGTVLWSSLGHLSFEPANDCNIFHTDVSVAISRLGRVQASWNAIPDPICFSIMLQTAFGFDNAPGNIAPRIYPLNPCIADDEHWPSSGVCEGTTPPKVVGWTKATDAHSPDGIVQQTNAAAVTQIRDCSSYWCGNRITQWQPCVWMREPNVSDSRALFAIVWAEPEADLDNPPFNIALHVWDVASNAIVAERVGQLDPGTLQPLWVNQPTDEYPDSQQTSAAVSFVGEDIVVTWVGAALPVDELSDCSGGDRIFARRFKFRNNQILDPDPNPPASEGQAGMFIVDNGMDNIVRAEAHPTVALKQYAGSVAEIGSFICAWNRYFVESGNTRYEVRGAYFDEQGYPRGPELRLNVSDGADGCARLARSGVHTVAYGSEGNVVLTWTQGLNPDASQPNVFWTLLPNGFWSNGLCTACQQEPGCCLPCLKGDVNDDCCIDGNDIQPFVNILFHFAASGNYGCASALDICRADMNGDHVVDINDVQPFVCTLLERGRDCGAGGGPCPGGGYPGGGGGGGNAPLAGGGEGSGEGGEHGPSESPAAGGGPAGNAALEAQFALLRAWDAAHPRPNCAYLSPEDVAWGNRRMCYRAQIGMISQALADDSSQYRAWLSVNRWRDHPELTPRQYEALVLSQFELYIVPHLGR